MGRCSRESVSYVAAFICQHGILLAILGMSLSSSSSSSLEKEIERYLAKSLSFKSKWKSVNIAGPNDVCVRSNSHIRSLNILMIFLSIVHSDNNLRSCSENVTGSRE